MNSPHNQFENRVSKREFGSHIESMVRKYLEQQQLRFLTANYVRKCGEIDLIFEDESGSIIFVEVRYRSHKRFGGAIASVDKTKSAKLKRTARAFLQQFKLNDRAVRIDVVAVAPKPSTTPARATKSTLPGRDELPLITELEMDWITGAVED